MVKLYCKHSISILNYCSFFIFRSFVGQLLESELAFGFKKIDRGKDIGNFD